VGGAFWKGRQEIQARHAWSHGAIPENAPRDGTYSAKYYGIFKNSTMKFNGVNIRFLGKDVALAHVKWHLSGDSRTSTPRNGMLLFVLSRAKDAWQIAAAQNTEINRTVK
jgi:uncharacterized protein (TIGR02246 family)